MIVRTAIVAGTVIGLVALITASGHLSAQGRPTPEKGTTLCTMQ